MKFAAIFVLLAVMASVHSQNTLPFPFNAIQVPQIVPAPFCLCGVLPRLKLNEKDECMKQSFCNNYMQPIQQDICNKPSITMPTLTPPSFSPQFLFQSLAQLANQHQHPQQTQSQPICNVCQRPTCSCNDYC